MEKQRVEADAKIAELTPAPPQEAVSAGQLAALQARLEQLHAAKQLTDDELFACEGECRLRTYSFVYAVSNHPMVFKTVLSS